MGWDGYHNRQKYVAEQKSKSWPCNGNTVSVRKHHAQGEELNETLYNAFNGERITRIQVEPGQWPLAVALKPER